MSHILTTSVSYETMVEPILYFRLSAPYTDRKASEYMGYYVKVALYRQLQPACHLPLSVSSFRNGRFRHSTSLSSCSVPTNHHIRYLLRFVVSQMPRSYCSLFQCSVPLLRTSSYAMLVEFG